MPLPKLRGQQHVCTLCLWRCGRRALAATSLALLASCSTLQPPPLDFKTAKTEIDEAAQTQPASEQPKAVADALLPPITVEMPKVDGHPIEPTFDLQVNKAPANQVFLAIVEGTRYSMVVHPDVKEPISINLKNVTVFDALETIREVYGYEYVAQGTRIMIKPVSLQTRVFQVNYLVSQRKGESDVRISSGAISDASNPSLPGGTTVAGVAGATSKPLESSRVKTTTDNDLWKEIALAVKAMIGVEDGRNVVVSPQAGVIVVRAYPAELRSVAELLETMSVVVERQVMLEAKIIEVRLKDGSQTGVNWAAFDSGDNSRFGGGVLTPGATLLPDGTVSAYTARNDDGSVKPNSIIESQPGRPGFIGNGLGTPGTLLGLAFQTNSFAAMISFLETQGELSVLSSPRIATLNNQKAVLKVGTDEFFVTNVTSNVTFTGTTSTQSPTITTQPFFSGVALDVTPQIDNDDVITLHIHPSVSRVTEVTKDLDLGSAGQFRIPLASSNISESDTIVRVFSGQIVAIGGLMKEISSRNRGQVPGAGDLPIVGTLFGNSQRATEKSELVILVKPTILKSAADWASEVRAAKHRLDNFGRGDEAVAETGKP
ncbi:MAG: pilus (MSHA type) biogenesis protein MshL [Burkholderiales bacterium]